MHCPGSKNIKKNTNSTQNKSQTHRVKQYEVTSFLSTDCELSTETCSKNVYSLGPWSAKPYTIVSGRCSSVVGTCLPRSLTPSNVEHVRHLKTTANIIVGLPANAKHIDEPGNRVHTKCFERFWYFEVC